MTARMDCHLSLELLRRDPISLHQKPERTLSLRLSSRNRRQHHSGRRRGLSLRMRDARRCGANQMTRARAVQLEWQLE